MTVKKFAIILYDGIVINAVIVHLYLFTGGFVYDEISRGFLSYCMYKCMLILLQGCKVIFSDFISLFLVSDMNGVNVSHACYYLILGFLLLFLKCLFVLLYLLKEHNMYFESHFTTVVPQWSQISILSKFSDLWPIYWLGLG